MQKQNNNVMDIDERPKGRKGIEEMLQRISEIDDSPSPQEKDETIMASISNRSAACRAVFFCQKSMIHAFPLFIQRATPEGSRNQKRTV